MRGLPQKVGFAAASPPQQALAGQNAVTDAGSDEPDLDRARPRLRNDDDWIICNHQLAKIMIGFRSCWEALSCYDAGLFSRVR